MSMIMIMMVVMVTTRALRQRRATLRRDAHGGERQGGSTITHKHKSVVAEIPALNGSNTLPNVAT